VAKEILTKHGLIGAKKTEETQPVRASSFSRAHVRVHLYPDTTPHTRFQEAAEPGKRLRPAHEVYNRIKWDSSLNPADYVIGYEDRFEGVKQISFQVLSYAPLYRSFPLPFLALYSCISLRDRSLSSNLRFLSTVSASSKRATR
jgi:hypothetical protein